VTETTETILMLAAIAVFLVVMVAAITIQYRDEREFRRHIVRRIRARGPIVRRLEPSQPGSAATNRSTSA
jgi:hypothetical protein